MPPPSPAPRPKPRAPPPRPRVPRPSRQTAPKTTATSPPTPPAPLPSPTNDQNKPAAWRDDRRISVFCQRRTAIDSRCGCSYNSYNDYMVKTFVVSMRLPTRVSKRLQSLANRHGWTLSDTSARLVEEGLRRSEFAFIDFRDSPA